VLEKAYAQYRRGYQALDDGTGDDGTASGLTSRRDRPTTAVPLHFRRSLVGRRGRSPGRMPA
jgi:hypothetical protein